LDRWVAPASKSSSSLLTPVISQTGKRRRTRRTSQGISWLPNWQTDKCSGGFIFPIWFKSSLNDEGLFDLKKYNRQLLILFSRPSGCTSELSRAKSHWPPERYANHLGPRNFSQKIISSKSDSASLFRSTFTGFSFEKFPKKFPEIIRSFFPFELKFGKFGWGPSEVSRHIPGETHRDHPSSRELVRVFQIF
jgi:hypothetical protein